MKININEDQIKTLEQAGWKVGPENLSKTFSIKGYKNIISASNHIFSVAEDLNHHPDLLIKYGSIGVNIYNHDESCISKRCYDFAIAVDASI